MKTKYSENENNILELLGLENCDEIELSAGNGKAEMTIHIYGEDTALLTIFKDGAHSVSIDFDLRDCGGVLCTEWSYFVSLIYQNQYYLAELLDD